MRQSRKELYMRDYRTFQPSEDVYEEIKSYIQNLPQKEYGFSIEDTNSKETVDLMCGSGEAVPAIKIIADLEHTAPTWIYIDDAAELYRIGMPFTRNEVRRCSVYMYEDDHLVLMDPAEP